MKSPVYFAGIRARPPEDSKQNKIRRLIDAAGFSKAIKKGDLTAIKIHFDDLGNDSYVNPVPGPAHSREDPGKGSCPFSPAPIHFTGAAAANAAVHLQTAYGRSQILQHRSRHIHNSTDFKIRTANQDIS